MASCSTIDAALCNWDSWEVVGVIMGAFAPPGEGEDASDSLASAKQLLYLRDHLYPAVTGMVPFPRCQDLIHTCLDSRIGSNGEASVLPPPSRVDAREILMALLEIGSSCFANHPTMFGAFVSIMRLTYCQLAVDNIHRKCNVSTSTVSQAPINNNSTTSDVYEAVLGAMTPWGRDIIELLEKYLLDLLCRRDAEPRNVDIPLDDLCDISQPANTSPHDEVCEELYGGTADNTLRAQGRFSSVEEAMLLLTVIADTTHMQSKSVEAAVAIFAAAIAAQPFRGDALTPFCDPQSTRAMTLKGLGEQVPLAGKVMLSWPASSDKAVDNSDDILSESAILALRCHVFHIMAMEERSIESDTHGRPSGASVTSSLLRHIRLAVDCTAKGSPNSSDPEELLLQYGDDYLDGGGVDPYCDPTRSVAIYEERKKALALVSVWECNGHQGYTTTVRDSTTVENSTSTLQTMMVSGLLWLLHSELFFCAESSTSATSPARCSSPVLTSSPASLFALLYSSFGPSLLSTSGVALGVSLLSLTMVTAGIPRYSLAFPGEDDPTEGPGGLANTSSRGSMRARTERYETYFNLVKHLVTLTAMCPHSVLREVSRGGVIHLLDILEEKTRIRMQCSLLTLTPFPSVCRFLLDNVLQHWRHIRTEERDAEKAEQAVARPRSSVLDTELPLALTDALQSFVQNVRFGDTGFVELVVVTLTFFRSFVTQDTAAHWRRLVPGKAAELPSSRLDLTTPTQRRPSVVESAWPRAFGRLKDGLLDECRALMGQGESASGGGRGPEEDSATTTHFQTSVQLSPLDEFSLESAIEAFTGVL